MRCAAGDVRNGGGAAHHHLTCEYGVQVGRIVLVLVGKRDLVVAAVSLVPSVPSVVILVRPLVQLLLLCSAPICVIDLRGMPRDAARRYGQVGSCAHASLSSPLALIHLHHPTIRDVYS